MKPANIGQIGHVLALAAALLLVPVHSAPTVDVSLQAAFDAPPFLVELLYVKSLRLRRYMLTLR